MVPLMFRFTETDALRPVLVHVQRILPGRRPDAGNRYAHSPSAADSSSYKLPGGSGPPTAVPHRQWPRVPLHRPSTRLSSAETPQARKLQYQQDLWGKAAYGKPMPFTARFGRWQRTQTGQNFALAAQTFGQNTWSNAFAINVKHETLNPWMIMGNLFIPVIPTQHLAGDALERPSGIFGQGVEAFGFAGTNNWWKFNNFSRRIHL